MLQNRRSDRWTLSEQLVKEIVVLRRVLMDTLEVQVEGSGRYDAGARGPCRDERFAEQPGGRGGDLGGAARDHGGGERDLPGAGPHTDQLGTHLEHVTRPNGLQELHVAVRREQSLVLVRGDAQLR